jgi:hypothetical protein
MARRPAIPRTRFRPPPERLALSVLRLAFGVWRSDGIRAAETDHNLAIVDLDGVQA